MTIRQWLTVGKVAVEFAWDLVTGKLERPAPTPVAVERARRIQSKRYVEASRNAGRERTRYCPACVTPGPEYRHKCGLK